MSTELKQRLEQILSLEAAPARSLTPEQRDALETIFGGVDDELALNALLQVAVTAFTHYGGNLRARYAMALAREAAGDDEDAGLGFHELARELGQREDWTGARDLAVHALSLRPDHKTIRLLLEIWDHLEDKTEMEQDLELAHQLNPEAPDLLWLDAQRAAEEGLVEQEEAFACQALNEFVRAKEGDRAEEPLLRILDSTSPRVFRDLLKILPRMATAGLDDLMHTTLELAGSKFEAHGLEGDLAKSLEAILLKHKDLARLRPAYGRALLMSQGGDAGVAAFIHDCGLDNPEIPLEDALERFREMYDLRPGAYVQHHNFGVGRISAHDGEFLIIDFEEKQGHRMALEIARRSLRPLPDGCLRVARFRDPEGIANEIANDPASLLVRALTELGGEATARDLRECLAGTTVPDGDWTSWWKKARDAAAKDDRVDTSQAYRQFYRLPGVAPEDEELELPALPVKSGPRAVITLVERLLKQHPELEDRVRRQYCDDLIDRVQNADSRSDALAAVPTLLRWLPNRKDQWLEIARHGLQREPGVAAGVNAEQQKELLAFGLGSDVWQEAALSALASRFPAIRDTALNALHERLGDEFTSRLQEVLVSRYPLPNTQLALVRMGLAGALNGEVFSAWDMLEGLVRVLGGNPPQKLRMAALELLDPQEELGKLLREAPMDDEAEERVSRATRELSASESGLDALVLLLNECGHGEAVAKIREAHAVAERDPVLLHFDPKIMFMSRVTFDQNTEKIKDLQHQLAVAIPREIGLARSLGDLSENAEYHAARERQGIADATLRQLLSQMEHARVIEDQHFPPNTVVVGTEVVIRSLADRVERTLWLLGQGDSVQDASVINYLAPLGQAIIGKHVGDVADFEAEGAVPQRLEIMSIKRRLPQ
ncbi:GreA/GreB family elongation factor [bacterium]|nr:GreA/GreB family elongation factor [bacterium]